MAQDIVGSKMPSLASEALKPTKAGYGQNGYAGASSDLPGENTTSGFLPGPPLGDALKAAVSPLETDNHGRSGKGNPPTPPKGGDTSRFTQTRPVKADSYPLSMGMAQRTPRNK